MKLNENYKNLKENYLFCEIRKRTEQYQQKNPKADIIKLGVGDVTLPLRPAITEAMQKAVEEMSISETFKGYPPSQGYPFLKDAIADYYRMRDVLIAESEIFVSDGAKSDVGNFLDIFDEKNKVLIPDPSYPVYVDANIMSGRSIVFMNASEENDFLPMPDKNLHVDVIYICSPNNPTGATYTVSELKAWVNYALENDAVILFDAAYEAYIEDSGLPHSIFEIEGARRCAVEICSFSKNAGFTGVRCGYTIVPKELVRNGTSIRDMWARRQSTKFNGVSYIVQRGAAAALGSEGRKQIAESVKYYKNNTLIIAEALTKMGIWYVGGRNSPYVWFKCPGSMNSWEFFDYLLDKINVVGTPGSGFGKNGENFFRLTGFGNDKRTQEAVQRFKQLSI